LPGLGWFLVEKLVINGEAAQLPDLITK